MNLYLSVKPFYIEYLKLRDFIERNNLSNNKKYTNILQEIEDYIIYKTLPKQEVSDEYTWKLAGDEQIHSTEISNRE